MGTPEMIAWEEPWRKQYPLVPPVRSWLARAKACWQRSRRALLISVGPCLLIIWFVHIYVRDVELGSGLWLLLPLLFRLLLFLLLFPLWLHYLTAIGVRCIYPFMSPFVEVTRWGVRAPMQFYSYAKIHSIEVVQAEGRAWLDLAWATGRRRLEIPPSVDLQTLKKLLQERDNTGAKAPKSKNKSDSFGRLMVGMLAAMIAIWAMIEALVGLLTLLGDCDMPW